MTAPDRLESELPQLLEHLYLGPRPPYADEALRVAAASPRPSAWSLAGPWPWATAPVEQTVDAPRLPWRSILAAGLIVLALVAGALIVGGRQRARPAPVPTEPALLAPTATKPAPSASVEPAQALPPLIGPAGNGLIAYIWRGDLYVGDPDTGETTAIVTGPVGRLARPQFSPDGTKIAFMRTDLSRSIRPEIVVVRADGSDERVVVPRGAAGEGHFAWTPDSASLVVANGLEVRPSSAPTPPYDQALSLVDASGLAEPRLLTPPLPRWPGRQWMGPTTALAQMFRPPAGDRIVAGDWEALDVFDAELIGVTSLGRAAIKGREPAWVRWPGWSPDGTMIVFGLDKGEFGWPDAQIGSFVMNADGTDVRELGHAMTSFGAGSGFLFGGAWSPDSAVIAYGRETSSAEPDGAIALVDVASGAERVLWATRANPDLPGPGAYWSWSPDGRSIVFLAHEGERPIIVDVATGEATEVPWESDSAPSWQRVPLD